MTTIPAVSVSVAPLCVLCQNRPGTIQPAGANSCHVVCTVCELDMPIELTHGTEHASHHK